MIDGRWRDAPLDLSEAPALPSLRSVLCYEVFRSYWVVLSYEHDGLTEQAETAREECAERAHELRETFDSHPGLGSGMADTLIAREVRFARESFARALQKGRRPEATKPPPPFRSEVARLSDLRAKRAQAVVGDVRRIRVTLAQGFGIIAGALTALAILVNALAGR